MSGHDGPEWTVTMRRIDRSRWSGIPTPSALVAITYAEHVFYQEHDHVTEGNWDTELLKCGIVVYPVLLTLINPAILGRRLLRKIGIDLGVPKENLSRFSDNFEDSNEEERDKVFSWVRQQGFDGAILPKDLMPIHAGGDWGFKKSFVAFYPKTQVQFALSI